MLKLKPTSPGARFTIRENRKQLSKSKPIKKLSTTIIGKSGRNNTGRITVRHKGGIGKRKYRLIDFKRNIFNVPAKVLELCYDPFRSAHIALIMYSDGRKSYIIAPKDLKAGDQILSGSDIPIASGNCMPIAQIPEGMLVHNVELKPGKGGQIARSAGAYASIVSHDDNNYTVVKLRSGEIRKVLSSCRATIGTVSNSEHNLISLGKAGASRHRGIRPTVRGTVMNACDHPHGGGEGKTRGKHPKTPFGKKTKGLVTRKNKRTDKFIVRNRRKNK